MKILLDEYLPRKLKDHFKSCGEIQTVPEQGWSGVKNGELLALAVTKKELEARIYEID